uniref:uncharacterized protein C16orf86 homolog isoform X1 n=1 Tax=Podarcis muralis TaxID=64176 RepID=UPI00109EE845|nr:uncharacterized protein C16orf86 homolog isoform X1 [Podarcis muralis]
MAGSARIPNDKKTGGKAAPPHFLFQLAAALDNPTIKSLEWHEDGKGILLHAKLFEEEIQRHQELFTELRHLKSVPVLQAWLATYGFKARMMKTDSEMLVFQHADFKKLSPRVEETEGPKTEGSLVPKQSKKSKKRKSTLDITVVPAASTAGTLLPEPTGVERKSQRLRPLYQYINYDNPEMNSPSDKQCDLPLLEVHSALENKTGPLEARITPLKGNRLGTKKGASHAPSSQIQYHNKGWSRTMGSAELGAERPMKQVNLLFYVMSRTPCLFLVKEFQELPLWAQKATGPLSHCFCIPVHGTGQ